MTKREKEREEQREKERGTEREKKQNKIKKFQTRSDEVVNVTQKLEPKIALFTLFFYLMISFFFII